MIYSRAMFRTARRALALSLTAGLVPVAAAVAAPTTTTTTTTTSSSTTVTSLPLVKPKAAKGSASLKLLDVFSVHGRPITVTGRGVHAVGVVRPYVAGQTVVLQVTLGRRVIKRQRLHVFPYHGRYGRFTAKWSTPHGGNVTVSIGHVRTAAQQRFTAATRYLAVVPQAGFGSTGPFVQLMQQRLSDLHLFIPRSGVYDSYTGWALDAYHRLLGWGVSPALGPATVNALLDGKGRFNIRFPRQGHHVEGNLARQLLAIADGSQVRWIFPISSGKPSTPTILGQFQIYRRDPGYLPDGMYFSSFFIGGYAIHGFNPAPDYPASHGCMRVPIQDAIFIYTHVTFGNWVDTYY
jgi:hypothetical protein